MESRRGCDPKPQTRNGSRICVCFLRTQRFEFYNYRIKTIYKPTNFHPQEDRMLNHWFTWAVNILMALWYILTGATKFYPFDFHFFLYIDANFKRNAIGSARWTSPNGLAEMLLLRYGVCAHPSMISGLFQLHPSITRDQIVAGYADMCMASAIPFYKRDGAEHWNSLPRDLFVAAPLPLGWSIIRGEDWIRVKHFYQQRRRARANGLQMTGKCSVRVHKVAPARAV